jgi:hypothetical protein
VENRLETRIAAGKAIDKTLRNDHPICGWPLPVLAWLDRNGARGLLADLGVAGPLSRQAAYIVAVDVDVDAPRAFLDRLGVEADGAKGIGIALRTRHARDLIAATYAVTPREVPTGLLRALARVQEAASEMPGLDALERCESYRRLFEIMMGDREGRRANALRFSGKMRSNFIIAVDNLDPVLVWPEVVRRMGTIQQIERANALLKLMRETATHATDEELVAAMRQSLGGGNPLDAFARKIVERADHLPVPRLPSVDGVRLLTTAAMYRAHGTSMRNCAVTRLPEAVLASFALLEVTHREDDGSESLVAVALTPMTCGAWAVSSITGVNNARPSNAALQTTFGKLLALGVLIPGPSSEYRHRTVLSAMLGVMRFDPFEGSLRDGVDPYADALSELEHAIGEAA